MYPDNLSGASIKESEFNGLMYSENGVLPKTIETFDVENPNAQKERAKWAHGLEFLLSCVSLSVGLGNLWKFPYVCYENGGAAFLIPYFVVLFLVGKPFYFVELVLGQLNSRGAMKAIEIVPLMKGIGWGQQFIAFIVATYYTFLIGLSLSYFVSSFNDPLPWATCSGFQLECHDASIPTPNKNLTGFKSSTELFYKDITNEKNDISDGIGAPNLRLAACLLVAWICIYLSIVKGIKTSGKLSYIFAIFPYAVLIGILLFSIQLEGAIDGIKFLFVPESKNADSYLPDFKTIMNPKVWYEASTQVFFSLTIGFGSIIMFSSYNRFDHNIYRDSAIISLTDTFTSVLGGSAIFAVLGNLAFVTKRDIKNFTEDRMAVSFILYPEAIAKISASLSNGWKIPQILAIIFFGMLFVLGVGSTVGLLNNITTNFKDAFPKLKYWAVAGVSCVFAFLIGIIYVTEGGMAMMGLIDHFTGKFLLFTLATLELVGIMWIYGLQEICWDVQFMLKRKLSWYWRICWGVIMPVFMVSLNCYMAFTFENPKIGGKDYPSITLCLGYGLMIFGFAQLFLSILYLYFNYEDSHRRSFFTYLVTVNPNWGPSDEGKKQQWREFKEEKRRLRDLDIQNHNLTWFQQKLWELAGKFQ